MIIIQKLNLFLFLFLTFLTLPIFFKRFSKNVFVFQHDIFDLDMI